MSEGGFLSPLPLLMLYFYEIFRLYSFRVMPQVCPPGLFILLTICCSRPAPVLVGLRRWRQHGACLGCSGHTSHRRDRVLLVCPFRLGEFSLHKLMWLGKAFWECCFVVGDFGALVKTSWSSHPATQSSQDSSGVTGSLELLGRWVRWLQLGMVFWD